MSAIASLSNKHIAIMDFMIANPRLKLKEVADYFGYTQAWLSQVIHSDAFQRELKEKQNHAFHHTVLPLREKMTAIAHQALDELAERLPLETDAGELKDVAVDLLDRLGFSPKGIQQPQLPPHLTVQVNIERERLARARQLIGRPVEPALLEDSSNANVLEAERVPDRVGSFQDTGAVPGLSREHGEPEEGTGV